MKPETVATPQCPMHARRASPPPVLSRAEIEPHLGSPCVVRLLDGMDTVRVAVGHLSPGNFERGKPPAEGAGPDHYDLTACAPDTAAKLVQSGERVFSLPSTSHLGGTFRGIVDICPLADVEIPPEGPRPERLAITKRAREIRAFAFGESDSLEWPEELASVIDQARANLRQFRPVEGEEDSAIPLDEADVDADPEELRFETSPTLSDALKAELNARLAVIIDAFYARAEPPLCETLDNIVSVLRQPGPVEAVGRPMSLLMTSLRATLQDEALRFVVELAKGDESDDPRLAHIFEGCEPLSWARQAVDGPRWAEPEDQLIGAAGFAVVSMVNVARAASVLFEEAEGRPPFDAAELMNVYRRSRTLIRQMALVDITVVNAQDTIREKDGDAAMASADFWRPELFELKRGRKGWEVALSEETAAEIKSEHNMWFDVALSGVTGCPAAVNFGEGNVINRMLEKLDDAVQAAFEAVLRTAGTPSR